MELWIARHRRLVRKKGVQFSYLKNYYYLCRLRVVWSGIMRDEMREKRDGAQVFVCLIFHISICYDQC